jgi:hypothetical protein
LEVVADPAITLDQSSVSRDTASRRWAIEWKIVNRGHASLEIQSVQLPHGQFKTEEQRFEPQIVLPPRAEARFRTDVCCDEPPGAVTENAFLIFQVIWLGKLWRIFVRIRVVVKVNGEPQTEIESITTQKAGFSGMRQ